MKISKILLLGAGILMMTHIAMAAPPNAEAPQEEKNVHFSISADETGVSIDAGTGKGDDISEDEEKINTILHKVPGEDIIVPALFFLMILGLVTIPVYFRYRKNKTWHLTIQKMIDKGVEIPAQLLQPEKPQHNDLRRGLVLMSSGVALMIVLGTIASDVWSIGLLPLSIGLAYIVYWKLQKRCP